MRLSWHLLLPGLPLFFFFSDDSKDLSEDFIVTVDSTLPALT